jgi:hypothetical protein
MQFWTWRQFIIEKKKVRLAASYPCVKSIPYTKCYLIAQKVSWEKRFVIGNVNHLVWVGKHCDHGIELKFLQISVKVQES